MEEKLICDGCGKEMEQVVIETGTGFDDIAWECHTKWCKHFVGRDIYKDANEMVDLILKTSFKAQALEKRNK